MRAVQWEVVPGLAAAIEARMTELRIDATALAERSGLSLQVLKQVRSGYRKEYQNRLKWPLCDALGWTPDSIDRLLRGEPAQIATPQMDEATADVVEALTVSVVEIRSTVAALLRRVSDLEQRGLRRSRSAPSPTSQE